MDASRRSPKSPRAARKRTSRQGARAEPWSARLSWRAARARGVLVHALANTRASARARIAGLGQRAASARARFAWRFRREADTASALLRPALASAGMAALVFAAFGTIAGALAAAGWTSTIALLLALRAAQHRQAVAVQYELHELRQQLHEVRQEQLHAAQAWMQVQEVGELDDAQEDVDEVDPHDEPTRARPARFSWVKRFGWHWPA